MLVYVSVDECMDGSIIKHLSPPAGVWLEVLSVPLANGLRVKDSLDALQDLLGELGQDVNGLNSLD